MNQSKQETKLIKAVFLSSMITMIMSNLTTFAGSMVDGVIISRFLGNGCMAAFQLSAPLTLSVVMIFQVFSIGVQNTCAKLLGAGRGQDATGAYTTSMLILSGLGVVMGAVMAVFSGPIATLLGATGDKAFLANDLQQYILGISFETPILCIIPLLIAVMFLEGRGKSVIIALVLQTSVDIAGDLFNALVLKKGMFGMGVATSVCVYVSFFWFLIVRYRKKPTIRVEVKSFQLSSLREVFRIGIPAAVDRVYKTVQMFVINKMLASVATKLEIAAFGSINTLNNIYNPITMGIGTAVLTMSAVFYGERDEKSIQVLMRYAVRVTLIVEAGVMLISIVGAPLIMRLFNSGADTEALNVSVRALRIFVLYLPIYGMNYMFQKYYNSIGNLKMTYILSAFDNLIYICLLAFVLGNVFGSDGVFFSFVIAEILTTFSMIIVMVIRLRRMPKGVHDMLDLSKNMIVPADEQFRYSAGTKEDVIRASEGLRLFCRGHGMSERDAFRFSLAVEEIGMNILRWGFEKGKDATMDIRMYKTEGWSLRIRDNGGLFDATKWLAVHNQDDPVENIGLRMVLKGASDVNYVNAMKINNLTISY